ncbi:MAG TPA: carboxypeptidase-like regulatory domain-containing protein [bacterium]
MKKNFAAPVLMLALAAAVYFGCQKEEEMTTGMIRGFVSDLAGSRLAGVSVLATPSDAQALTNDSGYYEITDLQPGDIQLRFGLSSYIPQETLIAVAAGEVTTVNTMIEQSLRNVVGELLNTACHCADDDRYEARRLKSLYGSRFISIACHASADPTFDSWDPFSCPGSESRRLYYADTFVIGAFMFFNGTTFLAGCGSYEPVLDSLLKTTSPLHMTLTGSYASSTRAGNVSVEITAVDTIIPVDLQVQFALYEIGPIRYMPPSPPETLYHYVMVDLLTPENLPISEGETKVIARDFLVPDTIGGTVPPFHAVNPEDIGIAVFVQSQESKEVLQAASIDF